MDDLITTTEAIKSLRISRGTFLALQGTAGFPTPIRIGRRKLLWRHDEVKAWLATR